MLMPASAFGTLAETMDFINNQGDWAADISIIDAPNWQRFYP